MKVVEILFVRRGAHAKIVAFIVPLITVCFLICTERSPPALVPATESIC